MLGRAVRLREVARRVDQTDVRLWEVPDQMSGPRIELLAEQANVIAQREQPLE